MNWGYKIVVGYSLFVAGMMFLVYKSVNTKTELIDTNYYQEELSYQKRMDENERTKALSGTVQIAVNGDDQVVITLPQDFADKAVEGTVTLYCPSDDQKDIKQSFQLAANVAHVIAVKLGIKNSGLYEVQLSWQANGLTYYHKEKLFL